MKRGWSVIKSRGPVYGALASEAQDSTPTAGWQEWTFQLILAGGLIGLIFVLEFERPVVYTRIITEDNWGENATALAFALTSALFLFLAWRTNGRASSLARLCWLGIGLGAGILAGEEMSWGQRFLGIETPEALRKINLQREFTLHNIDGITQLNLHGILVAGILTWAAVSWLPPRAIRARLERLGLPLAPFHLSPLLATTVWIFMARPFVKAGEVGELLFGVFMLIWALDAVVRQGLLRGSPAIHALSSASVLVVLAAATTAMSSVNPDEGMRLRLNVTGLRDLPKQGLHRQSDIVLAYIYEHPKRFLMLETRLRHGLLLLDNQRTSEAREVLTPILKERLPADATPIYRVGYHQRRGKVLVALGDTEGGESEIRQAIAIQEALIAEGLPPGKLARALLLISQSLEVVDRLDESLAKAKQAEEVAEGASFRRHVRKWIKKVEAQLEND